MALIDLTRRPTARGLRYFAPVLALLLAVNAVALRARSPRGALALGLAAGLLLVVHVAVPSSRGLIFGLWMRLVYPLAWTGSHAVLAATYFLVVTPIAVLVRWFRDPMNRAWDDNARTYFVDRRPTVPLARYFRQF